MMKHVLPLAKSRPNRFIFLFFLPSLPVGHLAAREDKKRRIGTEIKGMNSNAGGDGEGFSKALDRIIQLTGREEGHLEQLFFG